jgi:hypothetical protein
VVEAVTKLRPTGWIDARVVIAQSPTTTPARLRANCTINGHLVYLPTSALLLATCPVCRLYGQVTSQNLKVSENPTFEKTSSRKGTQEGLMGVDNPLKYASVECGCFHLTQRSPSLRLPS